MGTEASQPAHGDGAGGGAIGIVIGNHKNFFSGLNGLKEPTCGLLNAPKTFRGEQTGQVRSDVVKTAHLPCGVQACEHGMRAGCDESRHDIGIDRAFTHTYSGCGARPVV